MPKIDIGNLTAEQTKELAIDCLAILPWEDQIEVTQSSLRSRHAR